MKKFAIIILLIFTSVSVFSTASQAGAVFLMIYPGARAVGIGGAYTAIADDAFANYYNPAGMGLQEKRDVVLMHVNWLPALQTDMFYEYFGAVLPTRYGKFGASIIYLTTGETTATSDNDPTGRWNTFDLAVSASYAYKLRENLSLGASAKFIYSFLAPDWVVRTFLSEGSGGQGTSFATDLGVLYLPVKSLRLGLSLLNIGPGITYIDGGDVDPLPLSLKFGINYMILENRLNKLSTSMDITKVIVLPDSLEEDAFNVDFGTMFTRARQTDAESEPLTYMEQELLDTWLSFGIEYTYYNMLTLRGGYFLDYLGQRVGFTFGGGVVYKDALRIDVGVDSNIYDFDTSNYRISLGLRF